MEAIRSGKLDQFRMGGPVGELQSIAPSPVIPRQYASGGVVVTDAGASVVQPGSHGGNLVVELHPEAMNMTMRDWLEREVARQHGRR